MADSVIDNGIKESVANIDMKMLGLGPDIASNLLYQGIAHTLVLSAQNAVASQQRANEIANMAMAAVLKDMASVDPMEAVSVAKTMTGNDLAQQLSALLSALNSGQQATKSAQTTPPVTP
jgi:hypothetical protein